jgi:RNA methyltransferase PUA domain
MTTVVATLALMMTLSSGANAPGQSFVAGQENARAAQTVGSSDADAIRQRVKEGQKVRITDDQGREWQGRIEELAPNHLVLLTKDRQLRDVPYAAILRIDRPHDTLANGALIGFVSGAVYGLLAVLAEENADCEPGAFFSCGDPTAAAYVVIPPVLGAVGAGIGVAIDALVRRDPTLFRRRDSRVMLAPLLGREVRGVSLSVRW